MRYEGTARVYISLTDLLKGAGDSHRRSCRNNFTGGDDVIYWRDRFAVAALLVFSLLSCNLALADESFDFNLPEQSLAKSLREIGQRADMNILFDARSVERAKAPAVKGLMSAKEALKKVLAGTRFVIEEMNQNSVLVGLPTKIEPLKTTIWKEPKIQIAPENADAGGAPEPALQEVTVTAQRRSENLQNVPISVNTMSGETAKLRGAVDMQSLASTMANVTAIGPGTTSVFIRGLGSTSNSLNNEPSAATYVDGVYMPSVFGLAGFAFNNVERIEVLKGPQGTLFGRNTTAGVIQFITPDPQHELGGNVSLGYANYNTIDAEGYLTGGVTDSLAADLSVLYQDQLTGWGTNATRGDDSWLQKNAAARSKWLYTPSASTKITIALDYDRFRDTFGTQMAPGSVDPVDHTTVYLGKYVTVGDDDLSNSEQYGASMRIDQDFGDVHGASITAWRHVGGILAYDNDRTPQRRDYLYWSSDANYASEELQLSNRNPGRIQWLVGTYLYGNVVFGGDPRIDEGTSVVPNQYRALYGDQSLRSYSVFGQATAEIIEGTKLTMGLRNTYETLNANGETVNAAGQIVAGGGPFAEDTSYHPWTWRVALDHQFKQDVLGYVSYNRGFKSGGYNLNALGTAPYYPETVDAYEIGVKSEFLEKRVRLNIAAYDYEYKNIQVSIVPGGAGATQIFTNAASARSRGFDANLDFVATEYLTLSSGVGTIDARFTNYPNALGYTIKGIAYPIVNAKGNHLAYSPDFSGFVGGDFHVPTSIGNFKATANLSYSDSSFIGPDNVLSIPAYFMLSSSVAWQSNSTKPWGIRLWGRNLTNTYTYISRIESSGGWYQVPGAPRQYGVTLLKDF